FVNLGNAQGTLSGHLRLRGSRLSGSASCLTGKPAPLDAQARGLNLTGTVGGQPLNLIFRRQPPPPGALKPRVPGSLAGSYSITPSSRCLGGTLKLGAGSQPGLSGASKGVAGTLRYDSGSGSISGQGMCADGRRRTLSGQAADRTLTLRLMPLAPSAAGSASAVEELVATKTRSFEDTLAAFFI